MTPEEVLELDDEVREYLEAAWEDFRDLMLDSAHERHGIQQKLGEVIVSGADMVVIMDDGSIHHYRARLEKV